jgi:hypothetical protein
LSATGQRHPRAIASLLPGVGFSLTVLWVMADAEIEIFGVF